MKFARVHKRIVEENAERGKRNPKQEPIISESQSEILQSLCRIKSVIDSQVYDRNDILKKDAYFETTVMTLITQSLNELNIANKRDDRTFRRELRASISINTTSNLTSHKIWISSNKPISSSMT